MQTTVPLTEQTIAARLERLPNSRWHVTVTVILGVAIFFDSFDSLAIAYVLPVIVPAWHIPPSKHRRLDQHRQFRPGARRLDLRLGSPSASAAWRRRGSPSHCSRS